MEKNEKDLFKPFTYEKYPKKAYVRPKLQVTEIKILPIGEGNRHATRRS